MSNSNPPFTSTGTHIPQPQDDNNVNISSTQHDDSTNINQENEIMTEYSFYYRPCNDFQIYHIVCKEKTSDEIISQLLDNCLYSSSHNYFYSNDFFVFYFQ